MTFRRTRKLLLHDLLAVVDPAAASDRVALTSEQRGDASADGEGVVEVEVQVGTEDVGAVVGVAEEHVAADASPGDAVAHVTDRPRTGGSAVSNAAVLLWEPSPVRSFCLLPPAAPCRCVGAQTRNCRLLCTGSTRG